MHIAPFHVSLRTAHLLCDITSARLRHLWLLGHVLHSNLLRGVVLSQTKLGGIPAVSLKVLAEADVLLGDGVLADIGDEEVGDDGGKNAQAGCNPEGVLSRSNRVALLLDIRKDVGSDKGTDFADGSSNTVITVNVNQLIEKLSNDLFNLLTDHEHR